MQLITLCEVNNRRRGTKDVTRGIIIVSIIFSQTLHEAIKVLTTTQNHNMFYLRYTCKQKGV